ncbi:MAG: amidohydrolase family protein [Prolixibacteraceae bacterium]|jgi:N-acetylglucosamine-6-phosphate deacetylase
MKEYVIEGIDYRTGKPIRISMASGLISEVEPSASDFDSTLFVAPGLVDLQINGYNGIDLNEPDLEVENIERMTRHLWQQGVTTFFPTIITNSNNETKSVLKKVSLAIQTFPEVDASIGGIHLEGPFISSEDGPRGAHPKQFVQAPDWNLFSGWQEASGNRIRIVTLSPEWPGSDYFIRKCVSSGVVVSIGHTAASPEQIRQAVEAGARLSTHLGNGAHYMMPRHPNYIWEQLASENLWTTMIADGFHLPDSVLKVFLKVKPETSILVSDATSFAGLAPGTYSGHIGGEVELSPEGRLFVKGNPQYLAGSAQTLLWSINQLVRREILPLSKAWDLASLKPVSFLNNRNENAFQVGSPSDLVLFRKTSEGIEIAQTVKSGETVFNTN